MLRVQSSPVQVFAALWSEKAVEAEPLQESFANAEAFCDRQAPGRG